MRRKIIGYGEFFGIKGNFILKARLRTRPFVNDSVIIFLQGNYYNYALS